MSQLRDRNIKIIDCMVNVSPDGSGLNSGHIPREAFRDEASINSWPGMGVIDYLFSGARNERLQQSTDIAKVIELLDEHGIERAGVLVNAENASERIDELLAWGDRWFFMVRADPHRGMRAVRDLAAVVAAQPWVRGCSISPHAIYPSVPYNSKEMYPLYAKCVELDLPVFVNVGIPGPRVPGAPQDPLALDEVCWFFPELTVVMKHGGEPWVDLCVKLMLKWPNLYYSTSGFSPKYYPKAIIDYANTRGADKIIYAGYWPVIAYEDIFSQIEQLPLRDHVWQKMFSDNARRVLRLDAAVPG